MVAGIHRAAVNELGIERATPPAAPVECVVMPLNRLFRDCQYLLDPYYGEQSDKVKHVAGALWRLRELLIAADYELSAIAHGRPSSNKDELLRISGGLRQVYAAHIEPAETITKKETAK